MPDTQPVTPPSLSQADARQMLTALFAKAPYELPQIDGKVALYGAGNLGRLGAGFLRHAGITPAFALDRNPDASLGDIPVHTPDEMKPQADDVTLLVATVNTAFTPLADQLRHMGWQKVLPFYDVAASLDETHPLHNGWVAGTLSADDQTQMVALLPLWKDEHSLAAYLQFVAWRYAREDWLFEQAPVDMSNRFFIPEILGALQPGETYIDAGSYDGCVLEKLLEHTSVKEAYLFEPDGTNRTMLEETLSRLDGIQYHLHTQPLHSHTAIVPFSDGFGLCSAIREGGQNEVEAITLDSLNLKPTLIKLHVEGHELAVLQGAERTLKQSRPIIMATIYHNRDGLWKTAHWLNIHLTDYRFYFRLHSWCGTGAVIYAIPKERCA